MNCVSYSRVSSIGQNEYNKSVSLQAQEQICAHFAHENKLKIKSIYKEIHSAYNKIPNVLNDVVNKKKQTILCSSIDRFSRSIYIGSKLAVTAIKNKNKLIFIQEKLVITTIEDVSILKKYLVKSEDESIVLSNRIKKSRTYLINNGMFPGGAIPYGYDVIDKRLIENSYENKVIEFIKLCKKDRINHSDLNHHMRGISKLDMYVDIDCYDEDDTLIIQLTECLNNIEIVNLLNEYAVLKRGHRWSSQMINTAIKTHDPKVELVDNKLNDWDDIKSEISNLNPYEIISNNIKFNFYDQNNKYNTEPVKLINEGFSVLKSTESDEKNNMSKNLSMMETDNNLGSPRRSVRLNSSNTALNISNVDTCMREDVKLFKQFQEFQKFKNLMRD